ncbi:hypothetical protein AKG34_13315 [Peribacillus butanolivorans]|uniref:LPO_1073/Vpar_1526 family protein n=1 Tax=Peribacillus butanolivorans TaxID=421767 RepID=UPI0006A72B5A|nr:LPO_1073/Vpar_1526 family protein [Peribacillus butanolivorans]KON69630.1 hypothetical protein AKG34_13315 [Peribacillus butanolivorans]
MKNKQEITAGDHSNNIQGSEVTVNQYGLTYSGVKEVAMDVFKCNFYNLGEKVESLVNERAEEIINKYLDELQSIAPKTLINTEDPDLRFAIYETQKSHARRGEKDIADLLVDVLIQRTMKQDESFEKLVLNEALTIIPKLTTRQIDILSLVYMFRYLNFNIQMPFKDYYSILKPLIDNVDIPHNEMFYQHLQYSGCLSISSGVATFDDIMIHKFLPNLSENEVNKIILTNPELATFMSIWDSTKLSNSNLTSVGIAIAISNIKRKIGYICELSTWINE